MSVYTCKIVVKPFINFAYLEWEAVFQLTGNTDDVPSAYVPQYYPSAEKFLADQAIKFGVWLLEGVNGLLQNDGQVTVYDPTGSILWEKKAYKHATPPQSPSSP